MKSVQKKPRARRFLVGAACTSVILGFVACSGASEHRASPHGSAGGEAASGGAPASSPVTSSGGSLGERGGEPSGRVSSDAGVGAGGIAGDRGAGGDAEVAGHASGGAGESITGGAAGQATGGAVDASSDAGGAGGDAGIIDPVCGLNLVQVGQYSLWCGKVNEHTDSEGAWQPDADCASGCNVTGVAYCQKFYPTATAVVTVPQLVTKDWKNAGFESGDAGACNDSVGDGPGISGQVACCAPVP